VINPRSNRCGRTIIATVIDNNRFVCVQEIIPSGGFTVKNGETVGASWGGFHASASLADDGSAVASAGGNGLGASSGYGVGGVGAGAGLYGTGVASESGSSAGFPGKPAAGGYGNGGKPAGGSSHQGGLGNGFFDKIFAVSIIQRAHRIKPIAYDVHVLVLKRKSHT
jgi:hypothetical protein